MAQILCVLFITASPSRSTSYIRKRSTSKINLYYARLRASSIAYACLAAWALLVNVEPLRDARVAEHVGTR